MQVANPESFPSIIGVGVVADGKNIYFNGGVSLSHQLLLISLSLCVRLLHWRLLS